MIRTATVKDADQIHSLIAFAIGGTTPKNPHWIIERTSSPTGIVLVDIEDAHVIGTIVGQIVTDEAEIHDVVIAANHRCKGRGQKLVRHFEQHAQSLGASEVFLEVRNDNHAAIRLYEKLEYKPAGQRAGYYADGQDALVMRKALGAEL